MNDDGKKYETICLNKTIKYIKQSFRMEHFCEMFSGDIKKSERPDFIIKNRFGTIGIEHFLVDTLREKKKTSRSRYRKTEMKRTFEKYYNNIEGNEEKAINDIQSIVQADVDAIQNFSYTKFIDEFDRIAEEHAKKVDDYIKINNDINITMFLIEIPIARFKIIAYDKYLNGEVIKGRKFPITEKMVKIFEKIANRVDYIILSIIHEDYKEQAYVVYVLDTNKIIESIMSQVKDIYYSFTYDWETNPIKTNIKLILEKNEK